MRRALIIWLAVVLSLSGVAVLAQQNQVPITFLREDNSFAVPQLGSLGGTLPASKISGVIPSANLPPALTGTNNTWTGTNTYNRATFFGSGYPWIDVRSGSNGCAAAVGDGSTDDTAAIACQALYAYTTFGGGFVFFSNGNYHITSEVTLSGGTCFVGTGANVTAISSTTDITLVNFDATTVFACLRDLFVAGYTNTAATHPAVNVTAGSINTTLRDCQVVGGSFAFNTAGTDGLIENCFIDGYATTGGGINSSGANWYVRDKLDAPANTVAYAFVQQPNATPQENHFTDCDFSGNYTYSVLIADTNKAAITTFNGSVFSNAVSITGAAGTMFGTSEFSANITIGVNGGVASVVGSYGLSAVTATGASCAGNNKITC